MAPKNNKATPGHDDVSGLFARLGTQASEGYQDFAHTQLPPRKPGVAQASVMQTSAPMPVETVALEAAQPPVPIQAQTPTPTPTQSASPAPQVPLAVHVQPPAPVEDAASQSSPDALAPLRKLRQLDESAPRGVQPVDRPAQTPLERLFQRLLQADAPSSAQSPLKRLRSR
ncbi:hypothetical protein ASF73_18490 [Xanthomonas sp. Leaf131]|nr:hypothetical protein ASF73_18490 [Xanthomonas sp. Leaf131]